MRPKSHAVGAVGPLLSASVEAALPVSASRGLRVEIDDADGTGTVSDDVKKQALSW